VVVNRHQRAFDGRRLLEQKLVWLPSFERLHLDLNDVADLEQLRG
jgi:hypothetical protein